MTPLRITVIVVGGAGCLEVWHSFVSFGARSKASEARVNLKGMCTAQRARLSEDAGLTVRYQELGHPVERGNRYASFLGPGPHLEDRSAAKPANSEDDVGVQVDLFRFGSPARPLSVGDLRVELTGGAHLGVTGECPKCTSVMAATGNIDTAPDLDVWSVSTADRTTAKGESIPSCQPFHERDDVRPGPVGRLLGR